MQYSTAGDRSNQRTYPRRSGLQSSQALKKNRGQQRTVDANEARKTAQPSLNTRTQKVEHHVFTQEGVIDELGGNTGKTSPDARKVDERELRSEGTLPTAEDGGS